MFTLCFSFRYQYYQESDGGDGHPDQSCHCAQHHASHDECSYQGKDACTRCHQPHQVLSRHWGPRLQACGLLLRWHRRGGSWSWLWAMYMSVVEMLLRRWSTLVSTTNSWNCSSVAPFVPVPVMAKWSTTWLGAMAQWSRWSKPERTAPTPGHGTVSYPPATCHLATWCCQRHGCSPAARLVRSFTSSTLWTFNASPDQHQHTNAIRMTTSSPLSSTAGRRSKQPSWLNWGTSKAACSLQETAEMTARDTRPGMAHIQLSSRQQRKSLTCSWSR